MILWLQATPLMALPMCVTTTRLLSALFAVKTVFLLPGVLVTC